MQLKRGDIIGHEYMGIVDEVGSAIKTVKKGDRVVSSFQIAYVINLLGQNLRANNPLQVWYL